MTARAEGQDCPALAPFVLKGAPFRLHAMTAGKPFSILAIGSSSTQGIGASSPGHAYPAQLVTELWSHDGVKAVAFNAGIGGETSDQTLTRLKAAMQTQSPDLVIWQVGTNDALVGVAEAKFRAILDAGIDAVEARKAPLILIDPQVPASLAHDDAYAEYVRVIEEESALRHVPVVSRYTMMKSLEASDPTAWKSLLSADGLHMNDLGYSCLARSLAAPIARSLALTVRADL